MTEQPADRTSNVHQIFQGPVKHVAGRDVVVHNEQGEGAWQAERQLLLDEIGRLQQQVTSLTTGQLIVDQALVQAQQIAKCWRGRLQCACALVLLAMGGIGLQARWFAEELVLTRARRPDCEFGGAAYSWGARLTLPSGNLQCVKNRAGQFRWRAE